MQKIKSHFIAVLSLTLILSGVFVRPLAYSQKVRSAAWYDTDWSQRKLITIGSSNVNADLSDFPIYVDLNDLGSDFFSKVKVDGGDIVVTSSDGVTKLDRELISINTGSNSGQLWFKADEIFSTVDTSFYIYYGNASGAEANSTEVWSNDYAMVQHFEEDPTDSAPQIIDSTANGINGTTSGMEIGDSIVGQIGNGLNFDDDNNYINLGVVPEFNDQTVTVSFWLNFVPGNDGWIFNGGNSSQSATMHGVSVNSSNRIIADQFPPSLGSTTAPTALTGSTWNRIVAVFGGGGGTDRIYLNGVQIHSEGGENYSGGAVTDWIIGSRLYPASSTYYLNAYLDELTFSNSMRSSSWISTEYNNQSSPGTFYSVSSEQTQGRSELAFSGISNNEWDGVSQTEVCFEYFPTAEFAVSDAISLNFVPSFSSAVLDATPAENDADGDTTSDGSFTSLTTDGATYTFTDATTQATTNGISLCLDLPAGQSINSHSISMTDTNGSFGATLLHVADNNDVTVTLEITPTLSFNIRTLDDSADTNTCDLGTIDTTTLPNTDTTDDGNGECGYSLAIGTNATSGFQVQITSDGDMNNASSSIINATEDQSIAAGAEAYGLINITAAQTGSDGGGNFDQAVTKDGDFADDNDYTPVPQTPTNFVSYTDGVDYLAGTDNTDVTQVMHGMTVGSGTPAGLYQQVVTYTTTVTF